VEEIMELLEFCLRTMYSTVPLIQLYWLSRRPNNLALEENSPKARYIWLLLEVCYLWFITCLSLVLSGLYWTHWATI